MVNLYIFKVVCAKILLIYVPFNGRFRKMGSKQLSKIYRMDAEWIMHKFFHSILFYLQIIYVHACLRTGAVFKYFASNTACSLLLAWKKKVRKIHDLENSLEESAYKP